MCLDTLDKKVKRGRGYGYKVFTKKDGELSPAMTFLQGTYPVGEWISSRSGIGGTNILETEKDKKTYDVGFHIMLSKRGLRHWLKDWHFTDPPRKVLYRGVIASGKYGKYNAVVAREMLIEEEVT